jgi:pimeloyl-ACP methyl ester carboxylesterase
MFQKASEWFDRRWNPVYPRGDFESLFSGGMRLELSSRYIGTHLVHTAEVNHSCNAVQSTPLLMFVHGSPGDWRAWTHYLAAPELKIFPRLIAVDRPGFGGSNAGRVLTDLRAQATLLAELIPPGQRAIVVGHSLGGALAGWMAIDHADKVCAALSIAGSLVASLEAPRWYNVAASWHSVRIMIPRPMLWANEEMLGLATELERMHLEWQRLRVPFAILQGGKDRLVDPRTPGFIQSIAPDALLKVIRFPKENHFVLWQKPELIIREILALLRRHESAQNIGDDVAVSTKKI